jgi:hypothetical protein
MIDIRSIWFHDNIWALAIECSTPGDKLPFFRGHIDTEIDNNVLNQIEHLIIGIALYEPQLKGDYTPWLEDCLKFCKESNMFPNLKSVHVLYETASIKFSKLTDYYPIYGSRVRFFLLRSDDTEKKSIGIDHSKQWSFNRNKKALWMLGDITNRPHKFPLLYKFFVEDEMDRLDYSLTYVLNACQPNQFQEETYSMLLDWMNGLYDLDLDLAKMKELYFKFARSFEGDQFGEMALKKLHAFDLANYVFPPQYNNASLIINPETWWRHPAQGVYPEDNMVFPVTEKTWKPIAVKKPFIGISVQDTFEKTLESLGFRTFRKYTCHPELVDFGEGYIAEDLEKYINVAYERVTSFLDCCDEHQDEIWQDIEHNHNQWKIVLEREWDLLFQGCPPLKHVPKIKILRLFTVPFLTTINSEEARNHLIFGY